MGASENLSSQQFNTISTSLNGSGANKPNGQSLNQATRRAPSPSSPHSSSSSSQGNNTLPQRKVT